MNDVDFDITRFHSGDEGLFDSLIRMHSPRLLPYLRQYAMDQAETYDLLQEVWMRAFQKRASYRGDGSLVGWLLRVCRTIGLAAAAKRERLPAADYGGEHAGQPSDQDARIDADRRHRELRAAVADLPERQRDVVVLRIIEGRSTNETARALECAEGTVKATLHQALRKLREQLSPAVKGEDMP